MCPYLGPSVGVWRWGRCCVPAWHLWGHPSGSLSLPDPRLGKEHPHPHPWLGAGSGPPGLGMQPGNLMEDGGSGFRAQPAATHGSRSPGNCWLSDLCEMPVSSSERGQGSGDEGEGFLLFVAIPSCCLPQEEEGRVWATCPSCPLAAHQHAGPAAVRGSLLALCLQGYSQGGFGREAERVLARPHQAPLGNRVQAEIQASLNLPVCVWLLAVSCPQEGTSFPLKASSALSNAGPCAGPPGTRCPVVEIDQKWSSVAGSDDSGCKEESSMGATGLGVLAWFD